MEALRVEALPAGHGDSILIEYDDPAAPFRVLVDAGPLRTYKGVAARLEQLKPRRVELLVVTHIDADHIEGVVKLLNDAGPALEIGEVWFNGYQHLPPDDELGAAQGEMVSALLQERGLPWNTSFGGGPVRRERAGALPCRELPGGLRLTVLAPGAADLAALRRVWERECRRAGIMPGSVPDARDLLGTRKSLRPLDAYLGGPDVPALAAVAQRELDTSAPNASSIVLLAEYRGRSLLLAGDSVPGTLIAGLERLLAERDRQVLDVDLFKLPHHGSRYNVTREVLGLVRARDYVISSDGKQFGHPDDAAIARTLVRGPAGGRLLFNYRTAITSRWAEPELLAPYGFTAEFPESGAGAVRTLEPR